LLATSCSYENRSKQIQSQKALFALGMAVLEQSEARGPLTLAEIKAIASNEMWSHDNWGNAVEVQAFPDSWVIVYPGRDGQLDYSDFSLYLGREPVDIKGLYDHDLVFERHGRLLTIASKDVASGRFPKGPLIRGAE